MEFYSAKPMAQKSSMHQKERESRELFFSGRDEERRETDRTLKTNFEIIFICRVCFFHAAFDSRDFAIITTNKKMKTTHNQTRVTHCCSKMRSSLRRFLYFSCVCRRYLSSSSCALDSKGISRAHLLSTLVLFFSGRTLRDLIMRNR